MRSIRLALLATAIAMLTFSMAPAQSFAEANHPFIGVINGVNSPGGGFEDACGVSLGGGELSVSDYHHNAVDFFSSGGAYTSQLAKESPGSGPCKIELDSGGDLYVNNWHENVVKYNSSELLPGADEVIDSADPTGLTIEQATGDVYVAHRTYIAKYDSSGNLLAKVGLGSLQAGYGLALSEYPGTAGDLYIGDAATHTVKVYKPATSLTTPVEEWSGVATPQGRFSYLVDGELAVDQQSGHVYVLDDIGHGLSEEPEAALDEFNAAGDYRGQITGFTDAEPSGVAVSASGNVYVTNGNGEGSSVFEFGLTALARTLTIAKGGSGDGSVTSSVAGISCGSACRAEYNIGELVTLFAEPNPHSAFVGWNVTGSEPCPGTNPSCTVRLEHTSEIEAVFEEPTQQTLDVTVDGQGSVTSSPPEISCTSSCSQAFNEGRVVTLTAHPDPHHTLTGWSGCTVQSNPDECRVTMSATEAVSATFTAIPQLSLSVAETGTGQGTVTSYPPGISCPGACSGTFDEGSIVYLMAAPSPGSGFGGFSGGGCEDTPTLCAVSMSSATEVRAQFTGSVAGPAQTAALRSAASFSLAAARTTSSGALLTVKTPEAGTLLLSGSSLRPAKHHLSAGTSRVRVALSRRARNALFTHHHRRLRLRLAIGFVPADGGAPVATATTLRFRSPAGKARVSRR